MLQEHMKVTTEMLGVAMLAKFQYPMPHALSSSAAEFQECGVMQHLNCWEVQDAVPANCTGVHAVIPAWYCKSDIWSDTLAKLVMSCPNTLQV